MKDERQGGFWTHDEVLRANGATSDVDHDADIAYEAGQVYLLRRVRLTHVHQLADRKPVVTPARVAIVHALGDGYDWDGLMAALRRRRGRPAPVVVTDFAGAKLLIDGHHRVLAQAALGWKTIWAFVRQPAWRSRELVAAAARDAWHRLTDPTRRWRGERPAAAWPGVLRGVRSCVGWSAPWRGGRP